MANPTSLQLFKLTPRTNCGECGFLTFLAFATQVMVGNGNLGDCPHLDPKALAPSFAGSTILKGYWARMPLHYTPGQGLMGILVTSSMASLLALEPRRD